MQRTICTWYATDNIRPPPSPMHSHSGSCAAGSCLGIACNAHDKNACNDADLRGNSLAETSESYERWRRIVHHRRQLPQLFSFLDTKKSRVERSVNASELRLLPRDVRSAIASAWASQQALNGDEAAAVPNEVTELDEDFKHYMHYSREFRRVWAKDMIDRCTNKNEANLELYRQWKREMIETRVIAPMPFMKEPPQLKKQLTSKLKQS